MIQPSTSRRLRPRLFRNPAGEEVAQGFDHTEGYDERHYGRLGGEAELLLSNQGDQNALKTRKGAEEGRAQDSFIHSLIHASADSAARMIFRVEPSL